MAPSNPIRRVQIDRLVPHPRQAELYDSTAAEDEQLRDDIAKHGLRDPVEVLPPSNRAGLPPYTMLDGNRRRQALLDLGHAEVLVTIREDLVDADAATVEREFIRANLMRRQLHVLDRARAVLGLYKSETGRTDKKLTQAQEQEARDRIGKIIGISGRHLSRLFRILLTPIEVQRAVRDGKLSIVRGERVEGLPERQQQEIADRIRVGEKPADVVAKYIETGTGRHVKLADAIASFARSLDRSLVDLDGRIDDIPAAAVYPYRATLRAAHAAIQRMLNALADDPTARPMLMTLGKRRSR